MEQNINLAVHHIVEEHIKPYHICVDATCGNGHDTLFLAKQSNHVYAFDIQKQAIQSTKDMILKNKLNNVTLYHQSHDRMTAVLPSSIDIFMYNLGYLPHGDQTITTKPDTTVESIKQALSLLSIGGLISITLYIGHDGGFDEATTIEEFAQTLDKHHFTVVKYEHMNRKKAPYALFIQRIE